MNSLHDAHLVLLSQQVDTKVQSDAYETGCRLIHLKLFVNIKCHKITLLGYIRSTPVGLS